MNSLVGEILGCVTCREDTIPSSSGFCFFCETRLIKPAHVRGATFGRQINYPEHQTNKRALKPRDAAKKRTRPGRVKHLTDDRRKRAA